MQSREYFEDEFFLEATSNKGKGWCKNLKGFIPLRQFVENNIELKETKYE